MVRVRLGRVVLGVAVAGALAVAGCDVAPPPTRAAPVVVQGNPERGRAAILAYGCGGCHMIPGVRGADSPVGPPLIHWSSRGFIAGRLPNNEANLVRWIMDPQGVDPGNAMPDMGVTESDARDIAAYLFTIR